MNAEDISMEAIDSVLDDYYNEDDAMLEADEDPWGDYAEMEDEPWDDEEEYDFEDDSAERRSRSWYRRRAARRRALARARRARARRYRARRYGYRGTSSRGRRYMPPRRTGGKANASKVRQGFNRVSDDVARTKQKIAKVDLEAKVKADALREAVKMQSSRIGGSEYAISATKVIDEITQQFPKIKEDKILKTLVPLVPLAFLKPPKKGTGIESLVRDPRVIGAAIAGAVAIYKGINPEEEPKPTSVRVGPAANLSLSTGVNEQLTAHLLDQNGNSIPAAKFTWRSLKDSVVSVDSATGMITTKGAGDATLIATSVTDVSLTASVNINVT